MFCRMLSIHDIAGVEAWTRSRRVEIQALRRLRNDFYRKHLPGEDAVRRLPESEHPSFLRDVRFHALGLHSRHDSATDAATKLVFEAADGRRLESVVLRMDARTSLCISCQIGCAGGCTFCATGHMGFFRQLSCDEILDQVVLAGRLLHAEGRRLRNVVVMGMGEPFHNEDAVARAVDVMLTPTCFGLSGKRLMVSTVGIPDAMVRFAQRFPTVRLALSLHSARQEVRETLIPLARRYPLDQLRQAIRDVGGIQGLDVMVEYLLLDGVTDTDEDVVALRAFCRGLPCWVNLISYNPADCAPGFRGSSDAVRARFERELKADGLLVMTRRSLGRDIAAACGQLVQGGEGTA